MSIWNNILNVIFPSYCLVCGKTGRDLCEECLEGSPTAERETDNWIFPLFDYRHPPVKKAISLLKYKGKKRLAIIFAEVMYGRITEELADARILENFQKPVLIPIPLAPRRKRERGFNQSWLICKHLLKIDEGRGSDSMEFSLAPNVLIKPKDTKHQAEIKERGKRLRNLEGSFEIKDPHSIHGRNIILIDDVTTTGATLTEARKVLRSSGARKVMAFTIAH